MTDTERFSPLKKKVNIVERSNRRLGGLLNKNILLEEYSMGRYMMAQNYRLYRDLLSYAGRMEWISCSGTTLRSRTGMKEPWQSSGVDPGLSGTQMCCIGTSQI